MQVTTVGLDLAKKVFRVYGDRLLTTGNPQRERRHAPPCPRVQDPRRSDDPVRVERPIVSARPPTPTSP